MRHRYIVAAALAGAGGLVAAAAAGAAPAAPLASKGPWRVDYAPDSCLMGRQFVDGKRDAVLGWRALPLEDGVEVIVSRQSSKRDFLHGEAAVSLTGGRSETASFESFPTNVPGQYTMRLRVPATLFDAIAGDTVLTIDPAGLPPVAFALERPAKAFAALATCNDATLKQWGIDPAERARVARPPEAPDMARWITASDYPMSIIHEGRQGTTAILFRVAADGRIDMCRTVVSSGTKALDDAACAALTKRGRYASPALDVEGKPMAVHRTRRVVWRLPNWTKAR